jgi:hypothetical protein
MLISNRLFGRECEHGVGGLLRKQVRGLLMSKVMMIQKKWMKILETDLQKLTQQILLQSKTT